ncbi:MAG: serine hydrolase domain-containing protein, partial [Longimicrobiales bacterium]
RTGTPHPGPPMIVSPARTLLTGLMAACVLAPAPAATQSPVTPESVGLSSDRLDRLSRTFEKYVDEGLLPGAEVLVMRGGEIAYLESFGHRDLEAGDPMEVDDLFRIASQTKAIVSAAVMMLQEEGALDIHAPVATLLPEFAETTVAVRRDDGRFDVVPADRAITFRDLLTHTAGVDYGTGLASDRWEAAGIQGWYFADRDEPVRETVRRMAALPFQAHPGQRFVYGYATDILGAVVEEASGMPLDAFLRTRIFEPLGMVDTHFFVPPEDADRLAVVYAGSRDAPLERAPEGGGWRGGQGLYVEGPRASFSGGAGLVSTARDYARFLQAILNGGELDGRRILSPKSVELMTANHVGDLLGPAQGFGLGFQVVRDLGARGRLGSMGEFSWGGAYHSTYWGDFTEDLVVVYFTQVLPAPGLDDHTKLRNLVYQAIVDGGAVRR